MIAGLFSLARPLLHALDAETAHQLTIRGLALMPAGAPPRDDPRLAVEVFGRRVPNPVGLAAGFDKQCEVPDALARARLRLRRAGRRRRPSPSPATRAPASFAWSGTKAVINRFGLNSDGLEVFRARLAARGKAGPASSARTSGPTRTQPTASATTSPAPRRSAGSPIFSPSTSRRRTRRACGTSRARRFWTTSSLASSRRGTRRRPCGAARPPQSF